MKADSAQPSALTTGSIGRGVAAGGAWALTVLLIAAVRLYQWGVSPLIGPRCRFEPSCSHYAVGALREHGPLRGLWLTARRLGRCRPGGGFGMDPVPPAGGHHTCDHGGTRELALRSHHGK